MSAAPDNGVYFELAEYSGLSTSLTIDAQHAFETTSAAGGANDVTSGTATPSGVAAAGGGIVFGYQGSYSAFESCTVGTGFGNYLALNPVPGVDGAGAIEDKRITSNAAVAAIFSSATTGNDYYTQMLVIDEVSSGGSGRSNQNGSMMGVSLMPLAWVIRRRQLLQRS
ncbi:MAG TPA: hypothetical protein VHW95_00010 [Steroidobacteraceae bacterium]|jgi:hypothetical protein|nr:hypothetical protein [Steroidobacteraceae bacterium]